MSLLARKLVRDTRRQWVQFAAVALTLALGVAVFGAAYDSYDNLKSSYAHIYDRLRFADVTVTGGDTAAIAAGVRGLAGGPAVETRVQADIPFRVRRGGEVHTLLGRVVGQPPAPRVDALLIQRGRGLDPARPAGVVIERHMADHFHLAVGDTVEVFAATWRTLTVEGIAVSPEYLWPARDRQDLLTSPDDFGVVFADEGLVADLAGSSPAHQVVVRAPRGADVAAFERQVHTIAAANDAADVMTQAEQPSNAALQQDVAGFGQLAVLFPVLFLVAAALAAYVLLGRLVRTQRGQIGMLRANGYPRRRLLRHYLAYGAIAGVAGSIAGAVGGLGLALWLTSTYTSSLGIPLAVAHFHPLTPVIGVVVGTVAGALAAFGPARTASRVAPAEAMRGVVPLGVAHRSVVERVPGLRGLPVRTRLALRNLGRSPRRAVSTGAGVALAAVLVLSSLGMLDTVTLVMNDQFHHIQRQDAQLYLASPADANLQAAVRAVPGVAAEEPAIEAPVVISNGGRRYQTALTGFAPNTAMHRFDAALPDGGLLLGDALGSILHVGAGQTVDVAVDGNPPAPVRVAGFVHEPIGSLAYTTIAHAQQLAGGNALPSLLVRYDAHADRTAVRTALVDLPGVVAFRDVRGSEETVRQLLGLFYAIVGVMLLFGSILAVVVLFNTLSVNLSERTVELATLRAAGGRVATLARMMTGENLLLVAAAIPAGLVAGWLTGRWLMSSFNSDLYHFTLRLRPTTPLLLVAALLAIALLMHIPSRRSIRRLDVARVVRERAL
ncbi:MAG TPA: FtsX-like permease family protein [Acidimicrobiales bacterium]|nr:FtsX-like permease family protein [Acidimicrobiales bacterium]